MDGPFAELPASVHGQHQLVPSLACELSAAWTAALRELSSLLVYCPPVCH